MKTQFKSSLYEQGILNMVTAISPSIQLTNQDWQRILIFGSQQRSNELKTELSKAEQAIARFENRFGMSLSRLEEIGLPVDADFETHEAYMDWHSWVNRLEDLRNRLETLENLQPSHVS